MGKFCQVYFTNKEIEIQLVPCSYDFRMAKQGIEPRSSVSLFNYRFSFTFFFFYLQFHNQLMVLNDKSNISNQQCKIDHMHNNQNIVHKVNQQENKCSLKQTSEYYEWYIVRCYDTHFIVYLNLKCETKMLGLIPSGGLEGKISLSHTSFLESGSFSSGSSWQSLAYTCIGPIFNWLHVSESVLFFCFSCMGTHDWMQDPP